MLVVDVDAGCFDAGVDPVRSGLLRSGRSHVEETVPQSGKSREIPREMGDHQFQSGNGNYAKH